MSEGFLVVQDLHKSFNGTKAVNGISFTIDKGEIFGLLGPNGAGNILGVVISIFMVGLARFGMGLVNVPGVVMNIAMGFLLIVAILLPSSLGKLQSKILAKQQQR